MPIPLSHFDVHTPLLARPAFCDHESDVTRLIDEYMGAEGANLNEVTVVEVAGGQSIDASRRDPCDFWP
jgi:hypothetical protein